MSEDQIICVSCHQEEKDQKRVIECVYCHKCVHFKCKNIIGNAIRKLRSQPYFCSLECQEFHQRMSNNNNKMDSQMLSDIHNILMEVQETRSEMKEVKKTVCEMEKFQNFLSGQLDSLLIETKSIKMQQSVLKTVTDGLQKKQQSLTETVEQLEMNVDRINRCALSKTAVITGVPYNKNENVKEIIQAVAASVDYVLPPDAIVDVKRLMPKDANQSFQSAPLKVIFTNEQYKEELFTKKKNHGKLLSTAIDGLPSVENARNVIFRDELTDYGMRLFKEARDLQTLADWKFVWPGRNGVILAKKSENSKIETIRNQSDIQKLERASLKRQLNISTNSTLQSSPPIEPSPKRR